MKTLTETGPDLANREALTARLLCLWTTAVARQCGLRSATARCALKMAAMMLSHSNLLEYMSRR